MKIEDYHIIYLLGIGGIGMSALARWFNQKGCLVSGYDKTSTPLTDQLEAEGISVHFEDNIEAIPQRIIEDSKNVLVIYTPAIPKGHQELAYFHSKGYVIKKRSEVLGMLTKNKFTVAVAGTHGKTTTSTMIAHILSYSGRSCDAFLGGISVNLGSNLLVSKSESRDAVMVVEADEYDRSFLTLHPDIAVVTSADADHLDIYGDKDSLSESFRAYVNQIAVNGRLVLKKGLESLIPQTRKDIEILSYALSNAEVRAENITVENDIFEFDYTNGQEQIKNIRLKVPGFHNVENAVAATTVALELGISGATVSKALEDFKGVKRRFEFIIRNEDTVFIDDYAHHPIEIEAFLRSVKALYPNKKLTAIFQPHLFSRTRDFVVEFAESLSIADDVWLLDIYPARELPIPGVSSELVLDRVQAAEKRMVNKETILQYIKERKPEVLVTIGAGDIDRLIQPIKGIMTEAYEVE